MNGSFIIHSITTLTFFVLFCFVIYGKVVLFQTRPMGTKVSSINVKCSDIPVITICPEPNTMNMSAFPNKGKTLSNSSFIDLFGENVENIHHSEEVQELFETLMLSPEEVVKDIVGISQNGDKTKIKILDSVMPLNEMGECVTFGVNETDEQVMDIRY